jgi:hypothetical protein
MPIQIKRDPFLFAFAGFLVLVVGGLIWHGDVTFKEGAAFIVGALAMPALFGKKDDGAQPPPLAPSLLPPPFSPAISEKSEGELVALGDSLGPSTFPRKNDQ